MVSSALRARASFTINECRDHPRQSAAPSHSLRTKTIWRVEAVMKLNMLVAACAATLVLAACGSARPYDSVELQYIGNGKFSVLSSTGTFEIR